MPAQTSLLDVLMDGLVTHLAQELMTDITDPLDADNKGGVVRFGKLQADPSVGKVNILIHYGDEDWKHQLYTPEVRGTVGWDMPMQEIGGLYPVTYWVRRFIVELKVFLTGEADRDEARRNSHVVLSRSEWALTTYAVVTDQDSFGEQAHNIQVRDSYMRESGGEGDFIYRGQIRFEVFTKKDPPAP